MATIQNGCFVYSARQYSVVINITDNSRVCWRGKNDTDYLGNVTSSSDPMLYDVLCSLHHEEHKRNWSAIWG